MEVRVTPYHLEDSLVMTVLLWPQMVIKEVGKRISPFSSLEYTNNTGDRYNVKIYFLEMN